MTEQEIREGAPEFATHYRYMSIGDWVKFIRVCGGSVWFWNGVKWREAKHPHLFLNNPIFKPL